MSRLPRVVAVVLLAKAVRTYGYGYLGVLLPLHLAALGVGPRGIGVAVTLTLAASAALTLAVKRPVERLGSRAVLVGLSGLIVVSGLVFATTRSPVLVVLAAMIGNLAVSTGESGPFLAVEQVLVARAVPGTALTMQMSLYTLVGYAAAGLGAFTVTLLDRSGGGTALADLLPTLAWLFAAGGVIQAAVYGGLEPGRGGEPRAAVGSPAAPSEAGAHGAGALVRRLAALFALDSLAGGFALQSLIGYWLHTRFGLSPAALGRIFLITQVLTAGSLLIAARVAPRLGLVNTMVFSHLASNVLLIAMALAPDTGLAVALLFARALLSQIDVPTRQAFLMTVVPDGEREAAATLTNASRTVAQAVSPSLTGYVMQGVGLSAPFILGGALKIVYDVLLYVTCRRAMEPDRR